MVARNTTKQFVERATKLHNERYDYSKTEYIGAHTKVIIICNIHGEFEQTPRNHIFGRNHKGQGCPDCAKMEYGNTTRLSNEYIDNCLLKNNPNIERIGEYINYFSIIEWKCLICKNIWSASSSHIKNGSTGCPKCNDTKLTNEYIDNFLIKHSLTFKRLDDYINAHTKINWQCFNCDYIWPANPGEIVRQGKRSIGSGCPQCARGRNEKIVGVTLNELNLNSIRLRIDLPTGQKLFPDFYIPKLNKIIEYNGIQHYQPTCFGSMSRSDAEKSFEKQKNRDKILRMYCQENKIDLLEIDGREYKGSNLKRFVIDHFESGV